MLSDGTDRKLLRTRVQFLSSHEGQYQLGSVTFRCRTARMFGTAMHPGTQIEGVDLCELSAAVEQYYC